MLLVALCWVSCDGLAFHPGVGGGGNAPNRFVLRQSELSFGLDGPWLVQSSGLEGAMTIRKTTYLVFFDLNSLCTFLCICKY